MRNWLWPDAKFSCLEEVTPQRLRQLHIEGLVIDLDNTLVPPHTQKPTQQALQWIAGLAENGISVFLVSNNSRERVEKFCTGTTLSYVHRGRKPLPFGIVRACKAMQVERAKCALLGDQILTDVLGARLAGIQALLVAPMVEERDRFFCFKRALEKKILRNYREKGGTSQ